MQALPLSADSSGPVTGSPEPPTLTIERGTEGLRLHGVGESVEQQDRIAERYRWDANQSATFGDDSTRLAIVTDGLFAQRLQRSDYRLGLAVLSGWPTEPLPIIPGSVLRYRAEHEGKTYTVRVLVSMKSGVPGGMWFTRPDDPGWVDLFSREGSRIGEIAGRWPEVLSRTPIGPAVESFLAPAGTVIKGDAVQIPVFVADQKRVVSGIKIPVPEAPNLIEAESSGRWYAAAFVRANGMLERRENTYRVHYLGGTPVEEEWVPRSRWRPMQPVEIRIDDAWHLGNVLETRGDRHFVHVSGQTESARHWVATDRVRPVRLAEAERDGRWRLAHVIDSKADMHRVRFLSGSPGADEWLPGDRVRRWLAVPAKEAYAVVLPAGQLPVVLAWRNGETSLTLELASPVAVGNVRDRETRLALADADASRSEAKYTVRTAGDGSFALHLDDPLFPVAQLVIHGAVPHGVRDFRHPAVRGPQERRVLIIVDPSQGMAHDLDPEVNDTTPGRPQRLDAVRHEAKRFLTRFLAPQDSQRVGLWS